MRQEHLDCQNLVLLSTLITCLSLIIRYTINTLNSLETSTSSSLLTISSTDHLQVHLYLEHLFDHQHLDALEYHQNLEHLGYMTVHQHLVYLADLYNLFSLEYLVFPEYPDHLWHPVQHKFHLNLVFPDHHQYQYYHQQYPDHLLYLVYLVQHKHHLHLGNHQDLTTRFPCLPNIPCDRIYLVCS